MDRYPVTPKRRRVYERAIRFADLIVYLAVFLGGLAAVFYPPASATDALVHRPLLIVIWAVLLLGGGAVGFVGRLTRYWLVETPGTVAAFFGAAIYLVLVGNLALQSAASTVAATLVFVAMVGLLRRWLELQIFGTEPNATLRRRLKAARQRRTADFVKRES